MKCFIDGLIENQYPQRNDVLQLLRAIQATYHYIPQQAIEYLATRLDIPRTQIIGVIEFYHFLHLRRQGDYEILLSDSITDTMSGHYELLAYLSEKLAVNVGDVRADYRVSLGTTSCTGLCDQGPAALINGYAFPRLTRKRIDAMVDYIEAHVPLNQWPKDWFYISDTIQKANFLLAHTPKTGEALKRALAMGASKTLAEIDHSGLRGRGGAGFKTASKWRFCAQEEANQRYVICNADEGEPGTFKDRVLLSRYAHRVIEGMTLCAVTIGASQGFLYLRGEYLFLYEKLNAVLAERRQHGLLGRNILNSGFDFDICIHLGAGAYICGEESALIESLEGKMGIPRNRPPYPVTQGFLGKPTVINNVETFLAASCIIESGASCFNTLGTEKSSGTKILSISGDCERPGIYEYPFGVTIDQILVDCGARTVLGIQVGGPSGSFISHQELQRKLAFEDLASGGSFIVFNTERSIFDIVKNFTDFFAHESCGFCTPCRVGTSLLKKQLDKIIEGHGWAGDIVALEELCQLTKQYSHCGLGQTAANPVLSTLERYLEHYQAQIKQISYEPGFDLDASISTARRLANRQDAAAYLTQIEVDHEH